MAPLEEPRAVISPIEDYGSGQRGPLRPLLTEANHRPDRSSHEGLSVIATSSLLTRHSENHGALTSSKASDSFAPTVNNAILPTGDADGRLL
jgi:hypothetical protein